LFMLSQALSVRVRKGQSFLQERKVQLVIESVSYGKNVNGVGSDRTSYFKDAANGASLDKTFNYVAMGGDPFPGIVKNLVIEYHCAFVCHSGKELKRGDTFEYASPGGVEAGNNLHVQLECTAKDVIRGEKTSVRLVVDSARYGKNVNGVGSDRKSYYASAVSGTRLDYTFNYQNAGGDPFPGIVKNMAIEYHCEKVNDNTGEVIQKGNPLSYTSPPGVEAGISLHTQLQCSMESQSGPKLVIESARYGKNVNGVGADRTSYLANAVSGDSLTYVFNYTATGGDPFPGVAKNLVVTYHCEVNGEKHPSQVWNTAPGVEAGFAAHVTLHC